jgi:para-aminobenzoate synthetase component 1
MDMTDTVIFDRGPSGSPTQFAGAQRIIRVDDPQDVAGAFAALRAAKSEGKWLAGFVSYELGYCLSRRLSPLLPKDRDLPLLAFGVYDTPTPFIAHPADAEASLGTPEVDYPTYARAFKRLHDYIGSGDCYQVNLTFPIPVSSKDTPWDLYGGLAKGAVPHGAYVDLAGARLLSRSPELFFRVLGDVIETRPMKGTRPRGATPEADAALIADLHGAEKDRAENLMIVDLLRNDISRICRIGTVKVPKLFEIETYPTVHQMISIIQGRLESDVGLPEILAAMFPCGSVTGAPKIRAMEIIRELEATPRGAYCGAIGWAAPNGDMEFNVAIRTLTQTGEGAYRLNVGGGIVHDSRAEAEYEEALWKARFLNT